ncbi:uncharacterized protein RCC_01793 [Lecanosticta acicola]|uniref:Uncharacterized protein RCC_01793 n=1 Tax=Lecanosticta acicola TaxID=111012 RepID=A0AAI8YSM4_9PEZI|nr:uncharacterized protein RCC_01793 [Lecanosticta acicola]
MASSDRLRRESAAYRAYVAKGRLPQNAPAWQTDAQGHIVMYCGEMYCRTSLNGALCGKRFSRFEHLKKHAQSVHGALTPGSHKRVFGGTGSRKAAQAFYTDLMKEEDYEGKHEPQDELQDEPRRLRRSRPTRAKPGFVTSDGQADDEVIQDHENSEDDAYLIGPVTAGRTRAPQADPVVAARLIRRDYGNGFSAASLGPGSQSIDIGDHMDEEEGRGHAKQESTGRNAKRKDDRMTRPLQNNSQASTAPALIAPHVQKRRLAAPLSSRSECIIIGDGEEYEADQERRQASTGIQLQQQPSVNRRSGDPEFDKEDEEELQLALDEVHIKGQIQQSQLETQLQEIQLKRRLAALKKRKTSRRAVF